MKWKKLKKMKNINLVIVVFALIPTAFAICVDSDGGPVSTSEPKEYLLKKGTVTVATTSEHDYCITKIDGAKTEASAYIREFYCTGGKAQSRDYKCSDYKLSECTTSAGSAHCTEKQESEKEFCGDKKIQKPEECDPPDDVCIDKDGWPGTCSATCKCAPYKKPKKNTTISNLTQSNETAISTSNTSTSSAINASPEVKDVISQEEIMNESKDFKPVAPIAFNESIGIRLTYKVASFGHAIWNWVHDLW